MVLNPTWLAEGIPVCAGCRRTPDEIGYDFIKDEKQTNTQYVLHEEGTLDRSTGLFLCDLCYQNHGMPSSPHGWMATTANLMQIGITS
jgi:hypothetical protein